MLDRRRWSDTLFFVALIGCSSNGDGERSVRADSSTPEVTDRGASSSPCEDAAMTLFDCGTLNSTDYTQLKSACKDGSLSENEKTTLAICVSAATACEAKAKCIGR